jgi:UDP-N-acetylmuramoyl-L-alanyl-D-glutamate--2,6-diaminopimelate ligase
MVTFRLKVAGVDNLIIEPELKDVVQRITELPTKKVYVLATYTAVLQLRKQLADQKLIKEGMDA